MRSPIHATFCLNIPHPITSHSDSLGCRGKGTRQIRFFVSVFGKCSPIQATRSCTYLVFSNSTNFLPTTSLNLPPINSAFSFDPHGHFEFPSHPTRRFTDWECPQEWPDAEQSSPKAIRNQAVIGSLVQTVNASKASGHSAYFVHFFLGIIITFDRIFDRTLCRLLGAISAALLVELGFFPVFCTFFQLGLSQCKPPQASGNWTSCVLFRF